ncbi:transaldolase family protein [Thermodesulfobacteriota bacterium]
MADAFRTLCDPTGGKDGYDSLEVNPHLACDTDGTLVKVHRLWAALDRLNVFIKVPVTACVPGASESSGGQADGSLLSKGDPIRNLTGRKRTCNDHTP